LGDFQQSKYDQKLRKITKIVYRVQKRVAKNREFFFFYKEILLSCLTRSFDLAKIFLWMIANLATTQPHPPKHCSESQVLNLMSQEQEASDGMKGDIEVT